MYVNLVKRLAKGLAFAISINLSLVILTLWIATPSVILVYGFGESYIIWCVPVTLAWVLTAVVIVINLVLKD